MASTLYSIAEQVSLRLYGGAPTTASPIQIQDIKLAVVQTANTMLKVQHFSDMSMGENRPQNLMIATYPKTTLTSIGKKCVCTLPAMPVGLIRGMGIWQVSTSEDFECLLIPMGSGQMDLLRTQDLISGLMGQHGYEVNGLQLTVTEDLTINNTTGLYIRLIIVDLAKCGDFDPLPITSDMESAIVQSVYQSFLPTPTPVRLDDNFSANPQTKTA